jgi:RND superfamily putative drug exporter
MASWSATHPWRAIAMWVVFVAVCFAVGSLSGTTKMTNADQNIGEATTAAHIAKSGNFPDAATENVLVTARSGALDATAARHAADAIAVRMKALPTVSTVDTPVRAARGRRILVRVTMSGDPHVAADRVQSLLDTTSAVQRDFPNLRVEEAGGASIDKAMTDTSGNDFARAEMFSIPVTLLILLVAFGALLAAGVPVLLALSAVIAAIGLTAATSHFVPANDAVNSVVLLIGLAVGVDYSLFYLRRAREERHAGHDTVDAIELAAATSGHAVVVSGTAVLISMAGLFFAGDAVFSSFAVGSMLVVAVAVLGSLTVLPAILAKLGRWIDRPRVPLLWRIAARAGKPRFWPAVLRPALRHPAVTFVVSVAALLALAIPALGMTLQFPGLDAVSRTTPVMQTYDRMTAAFPSTGTTHLVAVQAPAAEQGRIRAAITDLSARTRGNPLFATDALTKPQVSADRTVTLLPIATPYGSGTEQARQALTELRAQLVPATVGAVPGAHVAVGGEVATNVDYAAHVKDKLPLVVGFVLLLTFLVMAATFRSVVVALTAIFLNLLSAGAAYGLITWVFQGSWAEGLLGFRSMHAVVSWLPLFLFVVLFGLSMDYHVFVVSRIREAVRRGVPTRQAVADGIAGSAGVVSSAALVMVAVFSIFATLSTIDMKEMGVGLAAAILIDATVIRAVVLPSLMTLLGKANWWAPKFLRDTEPARHRAQRPASELVEIN